MCTLEKRGNVFILTLTGHGDEHRLSRALIDEIHSAVHNIRSDPSATRSVLITTAEGKFFCNGLDIVAARTDPSLLEVMEAKFRSLVADLISLPMPTIAAVTGHASGAGLGLAFSHDYVLMRRDRGFLYVPELDVGLVVPAWYMPLIHLKISSSAARRDVVLASAKVKAEEAVKMGIVDSAHDGAAETVQAAVRLGEELVKRAWDGNVYGRMRETLLRALKHHRMLGVGIVQSCNITPSIITKQII
ncbi:PREDICTED: enoyl-CoA delta isomerase 1, peroxisomal-like [Tarenaya hassleriana]|uniref:enoyl-CoA delta isomerase 1, peroxisomal-like n=1 Tax=Tarenaya hassleriana TaxID=28532 RepID=UPI00053C0D95|nr:PREDICTED: enoyl-CoA delta isomerase 1, peroxisomal-like [Tarenaya hassleriana]